MLVDEDLVNDINLYLQEIGNEISASKVMEYLACNEVKEHHGITKPISERTAQHYLIALGYLVISKGLQGVYRGFTGVFISLISRYLLSCDATWEIDRWSLSRVEIQTR